MRVEVEEKTEDRRKFSQVEEMKTESFAGLSHLYSLDAPEQPESLSCSD